jgi:hypothetical protein
LMDFVLAAGDLSPATALAVELAPIIGTVLLTIITGVVGLASRAFLTWVRSNATGSQQSVLLEFARQAVLAAEQLGLTAQIDDKKGYAFDLVDKFLAEKGISLTSDQIEAAIEAAVLAEVNQPTVEVKTDVADVTVTPPLVEEPAVPILEKP